MATGGSRAVLAAFFGNSAVAADEFVAYRFTRSVSNTRSMFIEPDLLRPVDADRIVPVD